MTGPGYTCSKFIHNVTEFVRSATNVPAGANVGLSTSAIKKGQFSILSVLLQLHIRHMDFI